MNRSISIISLLLIITSQSLFPQSITNVEASAVENNVVINYQLLSSDAVEISLYYSEDGGRTFLGPLVNVSGDVGTGIQQGSRSIVWDVLKENDYLHNSNLVFRVKAVSLFGTFLDPRDGKIYKTVKIGKQVWMAENLTYKPSSGKYWAYDNNSSNVSKYGYLYDWQTASSVCPMGWHLPSDTEWTELTDFMVTSPGTKLKAKSNWTSNGNGTDNYGFSALPGGLRNYDGTSYSAGYSGYWWCSTDYNTYTAWSRYLYYDYSTIYRRYNAKELGFSVRCLKD